ncbi:MAG TPA: transglycosylase SLT domain-containing protein [Candidatus Baltobacteraceae bacterium]|nr:transglycosylase SLT domain-containing protein [Candidatus Baltobacteraceae bacterium]
MRSTIAALAPAARSLAARGVAFAPQIAAAAEKYGLDPRLLAAVAAQETGGPGSNAGRNVVGDGGHGHGIFQIDDRFHDFAKTGAAMNPQTNADYAAGMIAGLLKQYGGDVHKALSAYNAGSPDARGTQTTWQDGQCLGYADSVLRHYAQLAGESPQSLQQTLSAESRDEQTNVNALSTFAASFCPAIPAPPPPAQPQAQRRWQAHNEDFASIIDGDASSE